MRADEFIIEDITALTMQDFLSGYNQYCKDNNLIVENSEQGETILQFIAPYFRSPIIGNDYYFVTLHWSTAPNHKYFSVTNFLTPHKILAIEADGQLIVEEVGTGKQRKFPEICGPVTEKSMSSISFVADKEKNDFLFVLKFRFGDWKISEKTL